MTAGNSFKSGIRAASRSVLAIADKSVNEMTGRIAGTPSGLITLLFHSIFETRAQMLESSIAPEHSVLLPELRILVTAMQAAGYKFVTPKDLSSPQHSQERLALLTFDDGEVNNLLVEPLLREMRIPATFFIATRFVVEGRPFWWHGVRRELTAKGTSEAVIRAFNASCRSMPFAKARQLIEREVGTSALRPLGDLDRPMTPAELKAFASSEWVHVGNHTADHLSLPAIPDEEVAQQISGAQTDLQTMIGTTPDIFAYPSGEWDSRVARIAGAQGMRFAFTVQQRRDRLPLQNPLALGRFMPRRDELESGHFHRVTNAWVSLKNALRARAYVN